MLTQDVRKLLPIGSIVVLKETEKRLMIFGIRQTNEEIHQEYDYVGVLYPEGNLGEDMRFMFDHDDIDEVVFKGYDDAERREFLDNLQHFFEEQTVVK